MTKEDMVNDVYKTWLDAYGQSHNKKAWAHLFKHESRALSYLIGYRDGVHDGVHTPGDPIGDA